MSKTVTVDWWEGRRVMEFVYQGAVTEADLASAIERYRALTATSVPVVQLVDTLAVLSIPPTLPSYLSGLLEAYRDAGGEHVVMAASNSLNQMIGRSMSFGAGLKLSLHPSRDEAVAKTQELVAGLG